MQFDDYIRGKMVGLAPNQIFEARVKSLKWMLDCFRNGTIRKRTIINLIPQKNLEDLLKQLEEAERYEDCKTTLDILIEIYNYKNV